MVMMTKILMVKIYYVTMLIMMKLVIIALILMLNLLYVDPASGSLMLKTAIKAMNQYRIALRKFQL